MTDDRHEAYAFDRMLDGLVLGQSPRQSVPDDELSRFARRVQTTVIAPPPNRAFGTALRQSLVTDSADVATRARQPFQVMRRLSLPVTIAPVSRWRHAVEFAAMLLVIVALIGGIRAGDRLWSIFDAADDSQFIAAGDSSPAPAIPAVDFACETPPRTLTEMTILAATPTADPYDPIADAGGTLVDLESVHGILRTLQQIEECAAEGNLLAVYGNFSDRFLRRHLESVSTKDPVAFQQEMADPPGMIWPPTGGYVSIDDLVQPRGELVLNGQASLLGDGRVRVGVGVWRAPNEYLSRYTVLFVRIDDRWLIDEVFEADPLVIEVPAVVVGGVVPEPIIVTEGATPATPTD